MERRELFIDDHGTNLHIKLDIPETKGTCPVLILVHGFTGHMEEEPLLAVRDAAVRAGFAVLRAELYGHGKSGGDFRDHTILKWMENAEAVTEYAKSLPFADRIVFCGHSQGGLLAVLLGKTCPHAYAGLLELSPGVSIPDDMRQGNLLGERFDPDHIPDEIPTWEDLTLSAEYIRTMRDIDPYEAARSYPGPVMIIHGSEDEIIPLDDVCRLAQAYPDGELKIIEGDDHNYSYHCDTMAKEAEAFLRRLAKAQ